MTDPITDNPLRIRVGESIEDAADGDRADREARS